MNDKRKKLPAVLFSAVFFALCAFFSLGMLIPGAADAADSGTMPALVTDGKISAAWRDDFEGWFSKHFAYRDILVDAFSALKERVFRTGNDQVIVGRDGFLFFADTLADYTGSDPMTDEELSQAADALKNLSDYAAERGADFLFLCAPDKNTVYPEKMPRTVRRGEGPSNLDRLLPLLEERGVAFRDVRSALAEAKEGRLVYHRRDTHWNYEGARIALAELFRSPTTGKVFGLYEKPLSGTRRDFQGDLDSLLYPKIPRWDEEYLLPAGCAEGVSYRTVQGASSLMNLDIRTESTRDKVLYGSVLVFRDSFGSALIPWISSLCGSVRYHRALPYRIDLLDEMAGTIPPSLVVAEVAERNLRLLIGSDARVTGSD